MTKQKIMEAGNGLFGLLPGTILIVAGTASSALAQYYATGFESGEAGQGGAFTQADLHGQGTPAWISGRYGGGCCQTEGSGTVEDTSTLPGALVDGTQSLHQFSNGTTVGQANRIDSGGGVPEWLEFLFRVENAITQPFNRRSTFGIITGNGMLGEGPISELLQFQGVDNKIEASGTDVGNFVEGQWHALSIQMEKDGGTGLYTKNYTVSIDGVASPNTATYSNSEGNIGGFWFAARIDENSPGNDWYIDGITMGDTQQYTGPPATVPEPGSLLLLAMGGMLALFSRRCR